MKGKFILGLDIGTSSVRAGLYDTRGKLIPDTLVKNDRTLTATDDGGAEIDADLAFKQVALTIDDVLSKISDVEGEIECVATSSFWHSLLGLDSKGDPTTKVLGWADTRSREYSKQLRTDLNEKKTHDRTGARFHSSFWPAKLMWLRTYSRQAYRRTETWLSLSDFISAKLFGVPVTSTSMASGTGIFDIRKCDWDLPLLKYLGLDTSELPAVAPDTATFQLVESYAHRWPRLRNAKWFPAIADGAANNVGAGCIKKDRAAIMIGTSGAMRVAYRGAPPAKIPHGLWCYRVDRKRVIIGGALSDGGGLYHWLKENLRMASDDRTEIAIAHRIPGEHGLTFLPFLAGERSTGYHENALGAIIGLRSSTDTVDIVQAALESVAFRFAEIFDQLNSVCRIRHVIASGGALRESRVWTQMIADLSGRDMTLPNTHEASMRGAVLLALETTGRIKKIEDLPMPTGKKFKADKRRQKLYAAAQKRHQGAYRELIERENPE